MPHAVLWQAVAAFVRECPTDHVERVARQVEAGRPCSPGHTDDAEARLYGMWDRQTVPGPVLAAALRGAAATAADMRAQESTELVWTGPTTGAVPLRHTEAVLVQVVKEARTRVVLVSFVAYEVPSVVAALREVAARGVKIVVVLEAPASRGGRVDVDSPAKMRTAVPEAAVYVWSPEADEHGFRGAVHAKCAVADNDTAFVTSANLTAAAMWRNMELGVLIRGGRQPRRLAEHLQALVDARILTPA